MGATATGATVTGPAMGDETLRAPVDAILAHAGNVDRVAEAVETSHAAAAQVHLDRGAYGLMCQFMPEYFEPGMQETVDALAGSVRELRAIATSLRTAAARYASTDAAASDRARSTYPSVPLPL